MGERGVEEARGGSAGQSRGGDRGGGEERLGGGGRGLCLVGPPMVPSTVACMCVGLHGPQHHDQGLLY